MLIKEVSGKDKIIRTILIVRYLGDGHKKSPGNCLKENYIYNLLWKISVIGCLHMVYKSKENSVV